jgi:hypothetical protein
LEPTESWLDGRKEEHTREIQMRQARSKQGDLCPHSAIKLVALWSSRPLCATLLLTQPGRFRLNPKGQ